MHCDPADLTLLALGDDVPVDRAHLEDCPECQRELAALRRTVAAARGGSAGDVPVVPPPRVWDDVRRQLALQDAPPAVPPAARPSPSLAGVPARPADPAAAPDVPDAPDAPVPLAARRRTWPLAAAAAVAGLVVGGGAVWAANRPADPAPPQVLATATLDPLPAQDASGAARVVDAPDGQRRLVVDLRAPAVPAATYREVWLLDDDAKRLVSLGVLNGGSGEFVLPPNLDLGTYRVVDVSDEPEDGDPEHSGASLVRGALDV